MSIIRVNFTESQCPWAFFGTKRALDYKNNQSYPKLVQHVPVAQKVPFKLLQQLNIHLIVVCSNNHKNMYQPSIDQHF